MARPKTSKRSILFALYDKGFNQTSPEVKNTSIDYNSRKRYFSEWKRIKEAGGSTASESKAQVNLPGDESIGSVKDIVSIPETKPQTITPPETPDPLLESDETEKTPLEPEGKSPPIPLDIPPSQPSGEQGNSDGDEKKPDKPDGALSAATIQGVGIPVKIFISVKTLALWEISRAKAREGGEELTLGDFFDSTAEMIYQDRGLDLGLVTLQEEK